MLHEHAKERPHGFSKLLAGVLAAVVALCLAVPVGQAIAAADSSSVVAFSSDAHNNSSNSSGKRVSSWIDAIEKSQGELDYMGFTGDCGDAGTSESNYWTYVSNLISAVDAKTTGIYTTGNHEWSPGNFGSTSSTVKNSYTRIGEAADKGNYSIYCFGAASSSQQITTSDISTLETYLKAEGKSKPVFVLCHFPLHSTGSGWSGRSTTNASQVIDLLNDYPNVIYLWGHNHTLVGSGETHYDQIYTDDIDGTEINFTYAAAGCMSDSDYSSGSAGVEGKGLVAKVAADGKSTVLQYYDEDGKAIGSAVTVKTEGGDEPQSDNPKKTSTIEAGKQYVIVSNGKALNTTAHTGYTNSNGYSYSGFAGASVTTSGSYITSSVTDDMIWTAGGTSGAYTFTNGGKYLNATYVSNGSGGSTGTLKLDATSDTWSYSSSKLVSANSSKYLTFDTGASTTISSGSANLFTIRSESNANTVAFYEIQDTRPQVDVSGVKFEDKTVEADGNTYTITATNVPSGVTVTYSPTTGYSTAGTYTFTATFSKDGYRSATKTATLTIKKPAPAPGTTTYVKVDEPVAGEAYVIVQNDKALDTTAHSGYTNSNGYSYTGFAGTSVTIEDDEITSEVTTDMMWNFAGTSSAFTITNYESGKILNATYDASGSAYAGALLCNNTSDTWALTSGKLKSANATATAPEKSGVGSGKFLEFDTGSHDTVTSGSANLFTVRSDDYSDAVTFYKVVKGSQQDVDIQNAKFESKTVTWTGSEQSITATNVPSGVTVTYTNNKGTAVGTYDAVATFSKEGYNSVKRYATLTITEQQEVDIQNAKFEDKTVTWTGEEQSITATNVPSGVTVTYNNNKGTAVGTYAATATFSKEGYKSVTLNATLTIEAAPVPTEKTITRLAGEDALATMAKITQQGFADGSCDYVIVATRVGYWDALTAAGLAGVLHCPVLMTAGDELSAATQAEIERIAAYTGINVIISGGTAVVTSAVEDDLWELGCVRAVKRVAGDDAIGTSVATYECGLSGWSKTCIISTVGGYWDALAASPYAYAKNAPIFLAGAGATSLTDEVLDAIDEGGFDRIIITGGTFAVSAEIYDSLEGMGYNVVRLCGDTAVDTSIVIADFCLNSDMEPNNVGVATSGSYYDALAGAAFCGQNNAPIVLIADDQRQAISDFITPNVDFIDNVYVFGGEFAVSKATYNAIARALK